MNSRIASILAALLWASMVCYSVALAQVPKTINYQGYLTSPSGAAINNPSVSMVFKLYDAVTGGNVLHTETQPTVTVSNGIFNVVLGITTALTASFSAPYWLGVTVGTDAEMTPRQPLPASPYALRAANADALAASATITGSQITGTLTTAQIADAAVTAAKGGTGINTAAAPAQSLLRTIGTGTWGTLPAGAEGQVLKIVGGTVAWGTDNTGAVGVTSITAGAGLTGGTITGNGTIAVDPTSVTFTGNFFRQGGNAFGTAATFGTTDNQPVVISANGSGALRIYPNTTSPNLIGGYSGNTITPATVFGATIAGGGSFFDGENRVMGNYGSVGGGSVNIASDYAATIAGGFDNRASGRSATVSGGENNLASGPGSTIGGGGWNGGATSGNQAKGAASTIGGGFANLISADGGYGTIGGGQQNQITATPGSNLNIGTIAGGLNNKVTLGGGTVGGGNSNTAANFDATVAGGFGNTASGSASAVPGGSSNVAQGAFSFAAGRRAKANNDGCFAWADSNDFDFACGLNNAFTARATGGVYFITGINGSGGTTAGVQVPFGGNAWSALSDRNSKTNFAAVDARAVVERLARIPISTWNYKTQDAAIRHIGPMAQDFAAAFEVGEDDRHISTIDADGVALAAIQGLYQMLQEKDEKIRRLEATLEVIKKKLGMD